MSDKKFYTVTCPATLTYTIQAESKDEAVSLALTGMGEYLDFMEKSCDEVAISSALEEFEANEGVEGIDY